MPSTPRIATAVLACAVLLRPPASAQDAEKPRDVGTTEKVEVRLVTVDVLVLDRRDATVPGLPRDVFDLRVDGHEAAVDTLDESCTGGTLEEPHAVRPGMWNQGPDLAAGTRRIAFAFDYLHLPSTPCPDIAESKTCHYDAQAVEGLVAVLKEKRAADEEYMVAALTGGVRIEQNFTRDREEVIRNLERMEYDVTLYAGHFQHVTERPFFDGLFALIAVLGQVPGPKALVLFTAGSGPGETYEPDFRNLAVQAAEARVALYPVDARGLHAQRGDEENASGPDPSTLGDRERNGPASEAPRSDRLLGVGPDRGAGAGRVGERAARLEEHAMGGVSGLARLAADTGGRVTVNTNDMTLGYARARRDLGCRYTLGFYDKKPEEDRRHEIRVDVKRAGLRVVHPASYAFPSGRTRRESAVRAAFLAPGFFEGGDVHAHVFPLRPLGPKLWDAMITVDFPLVRSDGRARKAETDFGVVLRNGSVVIHRFDRRVSLQAKEAAGFLSRKSITFNEPVRLGPGPYTLTAVASDAEADDKPMSTEIRIEVPPIPWKKPFLVGPILGRRASGDVVVNAASSGSEASSDPERDRVGAEESFRPLLVQEVEKGDPLLALSEACVVKGRGDFHWQRIERWLTTGGGQPAGSLGPLEFRPGGDRKELVRCQTILDVLPVSSMRPGPYHFTVALAPDPGVQDSPAQIGFVVLPPGGVRP